MKFFIIWTFILTCGYSAGTGASDGRSLSAAGASSSAAASAQAPTKSDFPNYFSYIHENEAEYLLNQVTSSILRRLEIPYFESNSIQYRGFFERLEAIIQRHDPGAKVYISGGVVRSILGFIYQKLYNEHNRALYKENARVDLGNLTRETLKRLIQGGSHQEEPFMFHGEYQYIQEQTVPTLQALGVGSDLDILVKFSDGFTGKIQALAEAEAFINSMQRTLGLEKSVLINSLAPAGDVKEYDIQMPFATKQGGSTLDWFAFPVTSKSGHAFVLPEGHASILKQFLRGKIDYLPGGTKDKQTIRGLRPLLEIPFLTFSTEGYAQIARELADIIAKGFLTLEAQEQLLKMIRNARFEGAHNRFVSAIPGISIDAIEQLVITLNSKLQVKVPEFLHRQDTRLRHGEDKGGLQDILMPVSEFMENHTDHGILYHGTPDLTNVLNMIRNSLVVSKQGQGLAAHGRGVYTDKTRTVPQTYAKDTGLVLELKVKPEGLRILDWSKVQSHPKIEAIKAQYSGRDIFEVLANHYDIDIIVNGYPLIENAAAIEVPNRMNDLIRSTLQETANQLRAAIVRGTFTGSEITKFFNYLHPQGPFARFGALVGIPPHDDLELNSIIMRYLSESPGSTLTEYYESANVALLIASNCDGVLYDAAFAHLKRYYTDSTDSIIRAFIKLKKLNILQNSSNITETFVETLTDVSDIDEMLVFIEHIHKIVPLSVPDLTNLLPALDRVQNRDLVIAGLGRIHEILPLQHNSELLKLVPALDQVRNIDHVLPIIQGLIRYYQHSSMDMILLAPDLENIQDPRAYFEAIEWYISTLDPNKYHFTKIIHLFKENPSEKLKVIRHYQKENADYSGLVYAANQMLQMPLTSDNWQIIGALAERGLLLLKQTSAEKSINELLSLRRLNEITRSVINWQSSNQEVQVTTKWFPFLDTVDDVEGTLNLLKPILNLNTDIDAILRSTNKLRVIEGLVKFGRFISNVHPGLHEQIINNFDRSVVPFDQVLTILNSYSFTEPYAHFNVLGMLLSTPVDLDNFRYRYQNFLETVGIEHSFMLFANILRNASKLTPEYLRAIRDLNLPRKLAEENMMSVIFMKIDLADFVWLKPLLDFMVRSFDGNSVQVFAIKLCGYLDNIKKLDPQDRLREVEEIASEG